MFTINCKGKLIVAENPLVMGIINVTPDSFYESSRSALIGSAMARIETMVNEGADIIDIGGESTRPGSERISIETELERVIPVITEASNSFPDTIFSIDTYRSGVAEKAVNAGASLVNDIRAGNFDDGMLTAVASLKVPYICMHMKGTPR